jgi:hypothetical protein
MAASPRLSASASRNSTGRALRAFEVGSRFDDADLRPLGLAFQGLSLTHRGEVVAGTKLLDEAMAAATAGELTSMATGLVYCRMLCACLELQDFGRAQEWTRVIERCEETPALRGLPGDCRLHRAAIFNKRGAWAQCAQEALGAAEEAESFDLPSTGLAFREIGDVRLLWATPKAPRNPLRARTALECRRSPACRSFVSRRGMFGAHRHRSKPRSRA